MRLKRKTEKGASADEAVCSDYLVPGISTEDEDSNDVATGRSSYLLKGNPVPLRLRLVVAREKGQCPRKVLSWPISLAGTALVYYDVAPSNF